IGILCALPDRLIGTASRPVTLSAPHPGWAEEDPEEWWRNLCAITAELLARENRAARELVAVGITGMVPAVVLLDRDGRLIRPSIQQSDGRCGAEVSALAREIDPGTFLSRTGNGLTQQIVTAKLRWIEAHEPENFRRIRTVFGSYDYIAWRLGAARGTERNWALEGGFLDVSSGTAEADLLALAHLPEGAIPPVRAAHEIAGTVSAGAAAETGLPEGVPIIAGVADHVASAYAAGVVGAGDVLLKFGGAGDILLAAPTVRPDARVFLDYHAVPGLFMPNGCMASTGSLLNWIVREFGCGATHASLDRLAAAVSPGSEGVVVLPYFLGEKSPIQDPNARGTISGLTLGHGIAHIWRATLEAAAFGFRHHLDVFRELGYPVRRLLAADGGAASMTWMQIVADVMQAPVQLLEGHPGSCLGAAWLAAIGAGASDDWEGVRRFVRQGRVIAPDTGNAAPYDEGYRRYRALYASLRDWFSPAIPDPALARDSEPTHESE
ncbi:MAG TPA: FGGY family carbohydrate kinase, partial [Acetobacteraceae bacterium]|nr:FGGY family carbohydrate kinase [Acetobacteraceae bacterium]